MRAHPIAWSFWAFGLGVALTACSGTEEGDFPDSGAPDLEDPNQWPTAVDDSAETREREPVKIWLVVNDTDPDADALIVAEVVQPDHGFVEILPGNERVEYTSVGEFVGIDQFTYTASDPNGATDQATVTVNVEEAPILTVEITSPEDAAAVVGTSVLVSFVVGGCSVSSPGQDPDGCHLHRYLDGVGYTGGTGGIGHYSPSSFTMTGLTAGAHQITLEIISNDGSDQPVSPYVSDTVSFTVSP